MNLLECFEHEQKKRNVEQYGRITVSVGNLTSAMNMLSGTMTSTANTFNYTFTQTFAINHPSVYTGVTV